MQQNNCHILENSSVNKYPGLGALHGPNGVHLQPQFQQNFKSNNIQNHFWPKSKNYQLLSYRHKGLFINYVTKLIEGGG